MTITLEPETEARLCERAARDNQSVDVLANQMLAGALAEEAEKRGAFHQALLASGLVKRIARRTEPDTSERRLVEVQGEPISETMIRERR